MPQPDDLPNSMDPDFRFGASEAFFLGEAMIIPSLNRLEMQGNSHQIEPKMMKVLLLLCSRPGHVVYRDQILQPVWGQAGDDYLLNRAISELRKIFGDSAQNPTYIETIRKTGYRVVAPIKPVASDSFASEKSPVQSPKPTERSLEHQPETPLESVPQRVPSLDLRARPRDRRWIFAAIGVIGVCAAALTIKSQQGHQLPATPPFSIDHYQVYPATHFPGREYDAALSPDGSRIAYITERPDTPAAVFIKMVRGEQALQLSQDEGQVSSPQWMSDGQGIVYLSLSAPRLRILRVSPMGGVPQTVYEDSEAFATRGMTITGEGEQLVYAKRTTPNGPHQLWLLSVTTGESRLLTTPMVGSLGDIDPVFAPDGQSVVFVRGGDEVTKDIYRLDLASGTLTRLTHDNRKINGVAWSPNGERLLFTSTRSGIYRLWSIDRDGGDLQPLSPGWEAVQQPSTALGVEAIAFEDWKHTAKLMSIDLAGDAKQAKPLKVSHRWDSNPSISADGKTLVFASNRGGPFGIWRSALDSDVAYEWADLQGAFIDNPTWSPDGSRIVFDASPQGRAQLYLLNRDSSIPQPLPLGDSDDRTPAWSRDGQWIYFESNRSGSWQLYGWRVGSKEIRPVRVTDGRNPQESLDGKWLIYAKGEDIWRCLKSSCLFDGEQSTVETAAKGLPKRLISGLRQEDIYNWTPAREGIYYVRRPQDAAALPEVAFFRYGDGSTTTVSHLDRDFQGWGMTLSPDESRLYFTEMVRGGADIKIARPR